MSVGSRSVSVPLPPPYLLTSSRSLSASPASLPVPPTLSLTVAASRPPSPLGERLPPCTAVVLGEADGLAFRFRSVRAPKGSTSSRGLQIVLT